MRKHNKTTREIHITDDVFKNNYRERFDDSHGVALTSEPLLNPLMLGFKWFSRHKSELKLVHFALTLLLTHSVPSSRLERIHGQQHKPTPSSHTFLFRHSTSGTHLSTTLSPAVKEVKTEGSLDFFFVVSLFFFLP